MEDLTATSELASKIDAATRDSVLIVLFVNSARSEDTYKGLKISALENGARAALERVTAKEAKPISLFAADIANDPGLWKLAFSEEKGSDETFDSFDWDRPYTRFYGSTRPFPLYLFVDSISKDYSSKRAKGYLIQEDDAYEDMLSACLYDLGPE